MTIAICYHTNEGVVLGADSAITVNLPVPSGTEVVVRHFNHAQKIFEVGHDCSYGPLMIAFWGLGEFGPYSQRSLVAAFSDAIIEPENAAKTPEEIANLWNNLVWSKFSAIMMEKFERAKVLLMKDASGEEKTELIALEAKPNREAADEDRIAEIKLKMRTDQENIELNGYATLTGGYFLAGRRKDSRSTFAYKITYDCFGGKRPVEPIAIGVMDSQGSNIFVHRIIFGSDPRLMEKIAADPRWKGTRHELDLLAVEYNYYHGSMMPLRDAIEMVYSYIYSTIKALRFSRLPHVCGGPIEIATVTSDRGFRWASHKELNVAVHQALFNETRHV